MRRGRFSEAGNRARMMLGEIQEMYFVELRPENPTIAIFEAKSALKRLNHALFWHNSFQQSIKNKNTTVLRKKHCLLEAEKFPVLGEKRLLTF